ncbi:MAG: primosomal protein N', partial [Opitutales bacterium]|nr:primosomal protein N' [Opitutales bacterium]
GRGEGYQRQTQMIAKGLDFPNVSLVGIIDIDGIINFPDFRSSERAFQLMLQVAGRAGRGDKPGLVIIQSYNPQSSIIQLAQKHQFEEFTASELTNRREFLYPPFRHIIKFCVSGENEPGVKKYAENLQQQLKKTLVDLEVKPATPSILAKVNNKYRYTILSFSTKPSQDAQKLHLLLSSIKKSAGINLSVDVDPTDLV